MTASHEHAHLARLAFGIIGNVTSLSIFLSPIQIFYLMYKSTTTLEYSPVPYLCTLLNCVFWVFYGTKKVQPDGTLVYTINGVGAIMQLIYITIFFFYAKQKVRLQILGMFIVVVIIALAVILPVLMVEHKPHDRKLIMGLVCVIFCSLMYASPLSVLRKVIRTKSAESLPLYLSITLIANGLVWSLYAVMPGYFDPYILIPNGAGFFLGIIQVILFYVYNKKPAKTVPPTIHSLRKAHEALDIKDDASHPAGGEAKFQL